MIFRQLFDPETATYTYLLADETTREAVLVDTVLEQLERDVRKLRESMADGSYRFGKENLPYVKVVEHQDERILPFKLLLLKINETHIKGLDVEDG